MFKNQNLWRWQITLASANGFCMQIYTAWSKVGQIYSFAASWAKVWKMITTCECFNTIFFKIYCFIWLCLTTYMQLYSSSFLGQWKNLCLSWLTSQYPTRTESLDCKFSGENWFLSLQNRSVTVFGPAQN